MSWQEIPDGKALDLNTLPIGAKVKAKTTSKAIPVIELEKLSDRTIGVATGPVTIVNGKGDAVERLRYIPRLACLTDGLTNHFFRVNGQYAPLPRILGASLNFQIPANGTGEWVSLVVRKVEVRL